MKKHPKVIQIDDHRVFFILFTMQRMAAIFPLAETVPYFS